MITAAMIGHNERPTATLSRRIEETVKKVIRPKQRATIAETEASTDDYMRWNMRILRNPGLINFLDGCAASLPCHEPGAAPVGVMVCGTANTDRRTLAVAAALERALGRD